MQFSFYEPKKKVLKTKTFDVFYKKEHVGTEEFDISKGEFIIRQKIAERLLGEKKVKAIRWTDIEIKEVL